MVIFRAMTFLHSRVQACYDDLQVGHLKQAPGELFNKIDARNVGVELLKEPSVGLPLWPVRKRWLPLLSFALYKVARAELAVNIVVARDDGNAVPRKLKKVAEAREELESILELGPKAPLGKVAGDDQEIGYEAISLLKCLQVLRKPGEESVKWRIPGREVLLSKSVVLTELRIRQVEERDWAAGGHSMILARGETFEVKHRRRHSRTIERPFL